MCPVPLILHDNSKVAGHQRQPVLPFPELKTNGILTNMWISQLRHSNRGFTCWDGYTHLSPSLVSNLGIEETCRSTGRGKGWSGAGRWLGGGIMLVKLMSSPFSPFIGHSDMEYILGGKFALETFSWCIGHSRASIWSVFMGGIGTPEDAEAIGWDDGSESLCEWTADVAFPIPARGQKRETEGKVESKDHFIGRKRRCALYILRNSSRWELNVSINFAANSGLLREWRSLLSWERNIRIVQPLQQHKIIHIYIVEEVSDENNTVLSEILRRLQFQFALSMPCPCGLAFSKWNTIEQFSKTNLGQPKSCSRNSPDRSTFFAISSRLPEF